MMLLPPEDDQCPICASEHASDWPHNQQSLYYQYRFYGIRGRWPTWADAIAHCEKSMQEFWRTELQRMGRWSEPAEGQPVADPPLESVNQAVGDISAPGFGPEFDSTL